MTFFKRIAEELMWKIYKKFSYVLVHFLSPKSMEAMEAGMTWIFHLLIDIHLLVQ